MAGVSIVVFFATMFGTSVSDISSANKFFNVSVWAVVLYGIDADYHADGMASSARRVAPTIVSARAFACTLPFVLGCGGVTAASEAQASPFACLSHGLVRCVAASCLGMLLRVSRFVSRVSVQSRLYLAFNLMYLASISHDSVTLLDSIGYTT